MVVMHSKPETTLLPCPFCGGPAEAYLYYMAQDDTGLFGVRCTKCTAKMLAFDQAKIDAIEAWNARVIPAQQKPSDLRHGIADIIQKDKSNG